MIDEFSESCRFSDTDYVCQSPEATPTTETDLKRNENCNLNLEQNTSLFAGSLLLLSKYNGAS